MSSSLSNTITTDSLRSGPVNHQLLASMLHLKQIKVPWLPSILSNLDEITIDHQKYKIGVTSNVTTIENKPCTVNTLNLSGNCTLLIACPQIYSTLDSLDTYKKYFCTLDSGRYAGVCCIDK